MRLAILEEVVDLLLDVGSRLGVANDGIMLMFRPDVAFSYTCAAKHGPDADEKQGCPNRPFVPSKEPSEPELESERQRHSTTILLAPSSFVASSSRATVGCLIGIGCPPAITRFVIAIVISAIEAVPFRLRPHVSEEILKGLPAVTDGNTAPAVIGILLAIWVLAPRPHGGPDHVFTGERFVPGLPMLDRAILVVETATRQGRAGAKIATVDILDGPAITDAPPLQHSASAASFFKDLPSPESLAGEIDLRWHLLSGVYHEMRPRHA